VDIAASSPDALTPQPPAAEMQPAPLPGTFERRRVLSGAVDIATPSQIFTHLINCAANRRGCSVVGISAPYVTAMADDAALRDAFMKADLLIADGKGFTWGARMLGVPCGERIAIPDLCEQLLEAGASRGWKVFIYGATKEINAAAIANVAKRFPGLAKVDGHHGYDQTPESENKIIEILANENFNLLIVARPSPDKERFLARCCHEAGVVGLAAGGYADILAGKTARAPVVVQALGLEWLYRIIQEPRRLWKRIGWANARFAAAVTWRHLRSPALRPWWGSRTIQLTLVTLALCAAYVNVINAPWHFDDPEYVLDNPTIRSFKALSEIKVLSFRKLWWLSNATCYWLSENFGNHLGTRPDVRIFRAWNVICHFIAALALFGMLRRALRASGHVPPGRAGLGTPYDLAAFAAAAIFAAHPLATEAVTYISGRDNGQGGMFYLLGLYAASVAFSRMGMDRENVTQSKSLHWPIWLWPMIFSMAFGGCAVLTKESHLTFPAAVALLYLVFFRGAKTLTLSVGLFVGLLASVLALAIGAAGRGAGYLGIAFELMLVFTAAGALLGAASPDGVSSQGWRAALQRRISATWAFVGIALGLGVAAIAAFPYAYQRTIGALTGYLDSDYVRSLCTQAYAVPWMLLRTIAPFGLNIDHDFPTIASFADPRAQIGAAIIVALVIFGLIGIWKRWLGAFAVLLALIVIAPSNSIIERGDVVSERNFYLTAAAGACLIAWIIAALSAGIGAWLPNEDFAKAAARMKNGATPLMLKMREAGLWSAVMGCCVAGPFTSLTILRNQEWSDAYRLWAAAKARSPDKLRVLYNYGLAAYGKKHFDEADVAFQSLISIGEFISDRKAFRPDETVQLKCFHLAYANLAMMHLRRYLANGKPDDFSSLNKVDKIFRNGIERTVYDPDLCVSYAQFLMPLGRTTDAAPVLRHSLDLHPWAEQIFFPLGVSYTETGDFASAAKYLEMATGVRERHTVGVSWELPPDKRAEVFAFLGLAHTRLKQQPQARDAFRQSLELMPSAVVSLLHSSSKVQNLKLKPVEVTPPDSLITQLSVTRRDIIEALLGSIDDLIRLNPERENTMVKMLRNLIDSEVKRRATVQQKRNAFGFMNDPDAD
jgi:N-acetylglucosaminyldiphosphoundecaprenol N-acetyl-beta-D-mannosaminyltransferase